MAIRRVEFRIPSVVIEGKTNHCFLLSTPSVTGAYLLSEAERRKRNIEQTSYCKHYNQRMRKQCVDLSMKSALGLFDGGEDILKVRLEDLEGRGTISQGGLI